MATTTTTSGGTVTSFSNTPQAQDDIFTTGVIGTGTAAITEDLLGVVYLDVMSNDLGGNAKTLWSLDNATSLSTATKIYAPADLLIQDTGRIEATSTDTSFNGAKIWITSDGKVGYDAATLSTAFRTQLQSLAAGDSLTDSFTYAIRLGNGTLSWATAQVQFAGMNDSVTMNIGVQASTVTEDATTTPSPTDSLSATGTIAFSDVDLSDTHTASFVAASGNATALGNFTLASVIEAANAANGTVNWTYALNNAAAQFLAQGQTATETYVVTVSDGHGSSTTQNVTITITGSNDQVQITSGVQAGDAKEDSGDYAASGNITFTDVDLIDTHSITVTPGASGYLGSFTTNPLSDSTGTGSGSLGWNFAVNNTALQFLGEGQTLTQTYNVAIGDGAVQTVTITIVGTNDQVQITSGVQAGDAKEDSGDYAANGSITFTDVDLIDTHSVTVTPGASGYLGSFTTNPLSDSTGTGSGSLGWNFAVNNTALQFLGEGQTLTQTYNVAIGDGAVQTVTITITGSNDQVQITSGVQAGDAKEDSGDYSANGSIAFSDVDLIDTHSVTVTPGASGYLGSFTTNPLSDSTGTGSGSLGWNFAVNNTALQFLGEGQNVTQTYNVAIGDGAVQTVTITIVGTNDQVQITSGVQAGDAKEDSGDYAASGSIAFTDVDLIDTHSVTVTPGASGYLGSFTTNPLSDSTGTGSGSLGWNFAVNNTALQFLGEGQTLTQTYNVAIGDGAVQTVTITITGTNDQPTLTIADTTGAMSEGNGTATLSDSGALSFADLDSTDTVTVSQTANGDIAWSGGALNATVASALVAGFSVDQNSWDYSSNQNLDFLGAGETITFSYSVVATDDSGAANAASATQTVTITITGTNDAPVLSFATGNDAGAVQEDTTLSVSGQFSSADIDHAATATWSIAGTNTGTYGSIAVDSTGQWTYTLANGTDGIASAVQSLKAGESHDDVFSVQVSDGLGGVDTQLVTVTVTGTNDAPVLSFATGNDAGAVQEDTTLSVSGQFSSADIDHAATATWSIAGTNTGTYGSIAVDSTGKWTYTLANGTDGVASAVQSLGAGESHDDVFSVQVSDGLGGVDTQLVTVTVTGSNDAAVLSSASVTLTETDAPLTTSGSLTISDIDNAATFVAQSGTAGSYGHFSIGTNGAWTYVADSAHNEFVAGTTYTDTFAVSSADGTLTSVTVQILGSNDAAVLSSASVTLTETNAAVDISTSGSLTISDVDSAATFVAQSNTAGSYGQFSIGTNGAWTYVADSAHNEFVAGTTYTDTFAVSSADGTLTSVTVHINGTNDAAVLSSASVTLTETDAPLTTSGSLTISDVDSAATFVAQSNTAGSYGQFSIGTNGAWSYVADSAHNEFAAGTTYTDTFTVSSADGTLTSVTVHINGTNDAAVLSSASVTLIETDAPLTTNGSLTISDVDSAATFVAQSNTAGSYGQFSIGTNGAWSYVADSAHNEFVVGTTYTDTFSVSSADGTLTSVTVHINGTNDAAVLSADIANLTETNAATDISTNGSLTISDVDSAATFVAQTNTAGSYGQFSIGTNGAWSYVADSAHNEFVVGTTYTDTFAVSSADGTLTSVTVHINGTNDAAVLSADIANLTETNAATDISTNGSLTISDVDSAATFVAQTNTAGSYGHFSIGTDGAWTYVANSAHNEFAAGTTYTDTFAVSSADGTLTSVTVHINGTNDAAVLSADIANLTETNAATDISTNGSLTISDVDSAATFIAQTNTAGSYGQFSIGTNGAWTYVANSAHNEFATGTTYTDTFAVSSADGTLTSVTVHINGTNDAAVLSSASVTLTETDAPLTTSGSLTISDIDSAATFVAQSGTAGSYGHFSIGTDGAWTYVADSAHNEFVAGTTYTDTFAVSSADGTPTSVTVQILGSNDAAVLSSTSVTLTETDAPLTTNGSLTISDVDSAATFVAQSNTAGSYGQFSIGTNGAWTYVADSAHNEFVAGTTYTDTFAVSSADGTPTSVTVHILGSNDAAVLSSASVTLTETDAPLTTSGSLTISDIDSAATFVAQSGTAGSYGHFSIGTDGAWTYVADSAHNEFAAGTTYTDTFAVSSADGTLTSVTVQILGSNDAAVLSSASVTLTETDAPLTTNGSLTISDVDSAATFVAQSNTAGSYGQFSIGTDGAWSYVANSAHNEFVAGTTYTDTFAVSSADGTLTSVTVHINGTNDAAVLSSASINLTETDAPLTTNGSLTISDVDSAATFVAQSNTAGSYGQFSIGTDGAWSYVANSAHNEFVAGTTYTDTFAVSSADGTLTSVTVHINGTNDAAVLSSASVTLTETDAAVDISTSGSLTISDVDSAATFVTQTNTAGSYGQFSIGTNGAWTYVADSAHNEFAAGTTYTDTFAVSSADGTLTSVTVHINGTNDAAVLSSASVTLTETDAAVDISTSGSLTISDVDSAATFVAQSNTAGSYGQFSIGTNGAWTYVANSAHNEFAAGTTYTDTFAISSADGTLTSVTVHINGTNDAAVLSSASVTLTETDAAVDISTSGSLTISDVDSAATFVTQTNTAGSYGQFSIGTDGAWTYVANNAHNEFVAGTTYTDTFSVSSADGTLTSVTVHINGTNDAAVLSSASVTLTETNAPLTTAGTLTISDIDSPETFQAQSGTAGANGTFAINTAGNWSYTANSAFDALSVGDSLTDTFTVLSADGTATAVTVTINGSNDSPTITSNGGGTTASISVAENTTAVTTVLATDVDLPAQTLSYSIVGGADAAKFSIVSGTGALSFVSAPNFESPTDSGTNNVYDVIVRASDGTLFDDQTLAVSVTGINDNTPTITTNGGGATASVNVAENTTVVTTVTATDADLPAQTLSYSIVGGADAAKFSIVSGTGALSFISAPNFEAPTDSGTNNVYDVIVRASDGTLFDDQALAVSVTGVNDNSPVITSNGGGATASVNVAENSTAVTTVTATDADLPAQTLSYSILNTAGTDFSKFSISPSGVLTFNSAPDYENAQDVGGADGDNAYVVDVLVADGNGGTDTQTITVNVQNVVETPVDTVAPTVTVTGTALGIQNGSTSTVTFQFSEVVSGFNLSDVTVTTTSGTPRGTWSNFTQVDGDTYTATLTRTQSGSVKVDVTANSYTDLAGNAGAAGSSANLPAGVAGEPINLALNTPSADISGPITVSISGVPSGWIFNAGTDNGDGTWTVQTSDPGALTVTTPSDFAGALVLDVNMYWSNSDGSDGSAYVFNNIEVYAPDAPIFALSADDNLTGSSGADTFVFAQPIGNNQIYSFDAAADKIDLIGFAGVNGFADLSITNDANGNALVSIGSGQSVTLKGVDAADLSEANFQFDVDPEMTNTGTLIIADGAIMPFGGSIHNSGTIELGSTGSETNLEILFRGATLTGGGQVLLSDSAQNVIFGGSADTVLTNVDNRISGAGQLGAGQMVLVNAGLILASGLNSLVLDTGSHTITNSGVLESTGEGGMTVASAVDNSGHLWANGGDLRLLADVMGNGSATIDGDATLTFSGAAHGSVAFHGEGAGTLVIAQAEAAGSLVGILGLESDDMLTFSDLAFGANTQLSYSANASGTGGLLTVDDGVHRAEVNLLGHYTVDDFQATDGGETGTQVSYSGESSGTLVGSMEADVLSGGDGNDIIVGRGGEDTLSGGAGADVFAYLNVNEGGDHILDYSFAEGDTVDLSALLNANFVNGTSQVSDFVQLAQSGSDITVKVDTDGAANGTNFADVAVLANTATSGTDLVRTWFGEADHTLTA